VQFVRWGASGGFPVIALAPSTIAESYALTRRAFELAARFRTPVFLLTDKELNLTTNTLELGAAGGAPAPPPPRAADAGAIEGFRPYRYEPADGVPPLVPIGGENRVRFTGSTHDERAFLTKDAPTVARLNEHLAAKIERHRDAIEDVALDLEPGARTLLVSYGVVAGAQREAVRALRRRGVKIASAIVRSLWPVPESALRRALDGIDRIVVAELNQGQYRRELERIAGGRAIVGIERVDGKLIAPRELEEAAA
jgi:2-oxoglutarate ferredoxin oxidoreductase subunit alpha